jgi:spore germination protein PC
LEEVCFVLKDESGLSPWQAWSLEVQTRLAKQQEQIAQLQELTAGLASKLKQLESKPTYHIDNIQYHFDQLKVEKLEGTLNIGMTAPGAGSGEDDESIEQLAVGKSNVFPSASSSIEPPTDMYRSILDRLSHYLDNDVHQSLLDYGKQHGLNLDDRHKELIIEDVRKQLSPRIRYYLNQMEQNGGESAHTFPQLITDSVYEKTKRDADAAIANYMKQINTGTTGGL